MARPAKHHHLAVTLMGKDKKGVIHGLAQLATNSGCSMEKCHSALLGDQCVITVLLSGTWNAVAKMETGLVALEKQYGLSRLCERTLLPDVQDAFIPYTVQLVAVETPGIIYDVSSFFIEMDINICHIDGECFEAPHTGAVMFSLNMRVNIPADTHIPDLRERFMLYCDDLNLDAVLEPIKNS